MNSTEYSTMIKSCQRYHKQCIANGRQHRYLILYKYYTRCILYNLISMSLIASVLITHQSTQYRHFNSTCQTPITNVINEIPDNYPLPFHSITTDQINNINSLSKINTSSMLVVNTTNIEQKEDDQINEPVIEPVIINTTENVITQDSTVLDEVKPTKQVNTRSIIQPENEVIQSIEPTVQSFSISVDNSVPMEELGESIQNIQPSEIGIIEPTADFVENTVENDTYITEEVEESSIQPKIISLSNEDKTIDTTIEEEYIDTPDTEENIVISMLGSDVITCRDDTFIKHDLPSKYYGNIDFSSFQPYMDYKTITNTATKSYELNNSSNAYTDEYGLRRYKVDPSTQFTVDDKDDYMVALGTFYKDKGVVGNRYLIVTTTGMFTCITGDEKADAHTDSMNMFGIHGNGNIGMIEWIVDGSSLNPEIRFHGTVTAGGPIETQGEILYIYEIE